MCVVCVSPYLICSKCFLQYVYVWCWLRLSQGLRTIKGRKLNEKTDPVTHGEAWAWAWPLTLIESPLLVIIFVSICLCSPQNIIYSQFFGFQFFFFLIWPLRCFFKGNLIFVFSRTNFFNLGFYKVNNFKP